MLRPSPGVRHIHLLHNLKFGDSGKARYRVKPESEESQFESHGLCLPQWLQVGLGAAKQMIKKSDETIGQAFRTYPPISSNWLLRVVLN